MFAQVVEAMPESVSALLSWMVSASDNQTPDIPDHPLFKCDRWQQVGSAYFDDHPPPTWDEVTLAVEFDMKNYCDEIEKFLDWLRPYIDEPAGTEVATVRYEEIPEGCETHWVVNASGGYDEWFKEDDSGDAAGWWF